MTALDIIKDKTLSFEQIVVGLAREAENQLNVLEVGPAVQRLLEAGIICDMSEGKAPYKPRYVLPDYEKFMKQGSKFLRLEPPTDIWEAVHNLLILYRHVPSVTTQPVYLGNIDKLLEPFIEDEAEARKAIKLFITHIDRTITDSFCHANIGPEETKAGHIILELEEELQNSVPNLTLKYQKGVTPDAFAEKAIKTAIATAKPSFANHEMFVREFGDAYGIVSCYNGLHVRGGGYTLARLVLSKLAERAGSIDDFLEYLLPNAVSLMAGLMDERIRFLVEESTFFETNFLVKEGLVERDRFTGMFGIVGLAECVNKLLGARVQSDRFGHSLKADDLGVKIVEKIQSELDKRDNKYCVETNNKFLLHAQVGIDSDFGISPGCRIPIGEEPPLLDHIKQTATYHKYFPSGIGDIFPFDSTVKNNYAYVLDIYKGAFNQGMRYISTYGMDADVIRITGYLVKRSDIEALERGEVVLNDAVLLGMEAARHNKILERKVRDV